MAAGGLRPPGRIRARRVPRAGWESETLLNCALRKSAECGSGSTSNPRRVSPVYLSGNAGRNLRDSIQLGAQRIGLAQRCSSRNNTAFRLSSFLLTAVLIVPFWLSQILTVRVREGTVCTISGFWDGPLATGQTWAAGHELGSWKTDADSPDLPRR
jgi:hypothetical protein